MTQVVSAITWTATDSAKNHYAAVVQCVAVTDTKWNIGVQGTDLSGAPIQAFYATVDNTANNAICSIVYGPFTFTVPPYTRRTFQLPVVQSEFDVLVIIGTVTVTFTNYPANVPDEQNLVAVQQATQNVAYPFITVIASRSQQNSDGNHAIVFAGSSPIIYSLSAASGNTNGYFNPTLVNRGSANVLITPNGADTINGFYTSSSPLTLSPGDSVIFGCDGTTWWAEGNISFESAEFALTAPAVFSSAHNFRKVPKHLEVYLRCKTAEQGWNAGDEVLWSTVANNAQASLQSTSPVSADTTNVYFIRGGWNGSPILANKASAGTFTITLANWVAFVRAWTPA